MFDILYRTLTGTGNLANPLICLAMTHYPMAIVSAFRDEHPHIKGKALISSSIPLNDILLA